MRADTDGGLRPAIFLDRDGTLIEDRGDLRDPADVEFLPGVIETLQEVQGVFALFIVTNQAAVSAGQLTLEEVEAVNGAVVARLSEAGVAVERVFVCPHAASDACPCRKPSPHFLRVAAREHGLDLSRSFTVGDHPHDAEMARAVGATGIYVLTGHGLRHLGALGSGFIVVPALSDALAAFREHSDDPDDRIGHAARMLRRGHVVAFPTETVYGLGANALDPRAVARVFQIKQRPFFDPLIVHIGQRAWVERLARGVPPGASALMDAFWPGPLTVVLPKTPLVPDLVTSGLDTVALRVPAHDVALALLRKAGVPICAPSANPFGYVSPTRVEHVLEQLGDALDCVLDGGPCAVGIESTIVSFAGERPCILRKGGVAGEDLSAVLGEEVEEAAMGRSVLAPGMLPHHYAPRVRVRLFSGDIPNPPTPATGLLLQRRRKVPDGYRVVEVLSERGDLAEAAHNLFATLRRLDHEPLDALLAETAPEEGVGRAINDRLRRASGSEPDGHARVVRNATGR